MSISHNNVAYRLASLVTRQQNNAQKWTELYNLHLIHNIRLSRNLPVKPGLGGILSVYLLLIVYPTYSLVYTRVYRTPG